MKKFIFILTTFTNLTKLYLHNSAYYNFNDNVFTLKNEQMYLQIRIFFN